MSRNRIDWEAVWPDGVVFGRGQARADRAGLAAWVAGLDGHAEGVVAAVESMTGARFVHDSLEGLGWEVQVADARRARERIVALADTRGVKTDRTARPAWPTWPGAAWCRRCGCPTRGCGADASWPGFGCTWSSTAAC